MITVNEPEGSIKVNKISDTFRTVPDTYTKNENAVPVPVEPEESVPVSMMQDIPSTDEYPMSAEADVVSDPAKLADKKSEEKYDDPKYATVLKALDELGFYDSKFLGASGYVIPFNPDYELVSLICPNLKDGFLMNIKGGHAKAGSAAQYASEINSLIEIVDQLNALLAGATDVSTMDRHVSEAEIIQIQNQLNESVISSGDQNFGQPGTYVLFRNGVDKTLRGLISFSDHFQGADEYKNKENPLPTKKYLVKIKNPLVVNAQTSLGAFRIAYKMTLGKEVNLDDPNKTINDMWRAADKEMAAALEKDGYDALIYKVPSGNEVLVVGTDITKLPAISEYTESVKNIANSTE